MNGNTNISDLFLTAYLITQGFKPIGRVVEGHNTLFQFKTSPELEKTIEQYYTGETSVNAATFADKYRFVLNMVKSLRTAGR